MTKWKRTVLVGAAALLGCLPFATPKAMAWDAADRPAFDHARGVGPG